MSRLDRDKMMRTLQIAELAAVAGGASTSNNGFKSNSGQGNLANTNVKYNAGTTTESGPQGVLKNDNTNNPNYMIDLPGASR